MGQIITIPKVLSISAFAGTYTEKTAPLWLRRQQKVVANNVFMDFFPIVPEGLVVTGFEVQYYCTAATASDTITVTLDGCGDPFGDQTTLTSALTAAATTVALTTRTGFPQYEYGLLLSADMTKKEWIQVTSSVATGAGSHTIVRGRFGTTAQAFASGDYLLWSRGWKTLETDDSTTTTATTGAVDVSGATATVPVDGQISSEKLNIDLITYPALRLSLAAGGSPTVDAYVDLVLICQ